MTTVLAIGSVPSHVTGQDEPDGDEGADPRWLGGAGGRGASSRATSRRKSRVTKQHSYDDEVKPGGPPAAAAAQGEPALGGYHGSGG